MVERATYIYNRLFWTPMVTHFPTAGHGDMHDALREQTASGPSGAVWSPPWSATHAWSTCICISSIT